MTTTDNRPDLAAFIAEVRARLADLSADDRDELLDGLDADLADQLADGATHVLDDPAAYAAELRTAAGLPSAPRRRLVWPTADRLDSTLDELPERWAGVVGQDPRVRAAWEVVVAARPAWWVLRAWVAVTLLDQAAGRYEPVTVMPSLLVPFAGPVVLLAAVAVSVLIGQGRIWPGRRPRPRGWPRMILLLLNTVAVISLVSLTQDSSNARFFTSDYSAPGPDSQPGVVVDGRTVRNIYPYDAAGQPLTGVQLFDGAGRPIALSLEQAQVGEWGAVDRVVGCAWVNGTRRLFNVFPLPERVQRRGTCTENLDTRLGGGALPTPPLAQVPPVSLPTVAP